MSIKVGDKVQVIRRLDEVRGWDNTWYDSEGKGDDMTAYVNDGKEYTVKSIDKSGVRFAEDPTYGFPYGSLQKVGGDGEDGVEAEEPIMVGPYRIVKMTVYTVGVHKFDTEKEARDHCKSWLLQDAIGGGELTLQKILDNANKVVEVLQQVK